MSYLKKKTIKVRSVLLSVILIMELCFSCNWMSAYADEADDNTTFLPPKKVVSIVYDDSTSMRAFGGKLLDNWATANYAMQSLTALLSTSDELYITKMSDYKHSEKVDLNNKSQAIKEIRNNVEWADGTYLEAAAIAMKRLKEQSKGEKDENTQYWLVIVTDGAMETYQGKDLQTLLDEYKGYTFPNGSQLYIKYMSIGTEAVGINDDIENGLQSCPAGNNIVGTLNDIAKNVSGCFEFGEASNSSIEIIDKRTILLHSEIPLYNISLFSQNSNASVVSASLNEDNKMITSESVYMEVTNPKNAGNNRKNFVDDNTKNLKGYEFKIGLNNELLPAGDYTITFSSNISKDNFVAMYQPAIGLDLVVTEDGEEIVPENLREGDNLAIELSAVNPITGNTIPIENLPKDVTWAISYSNEEEEIDAVHFDTNDELKWEIEDVEAGNITIKGTMYIPDYAPTNTYSSVYINESRAITITPVSAAGDAVYERMKLGKDGCETPLTFQLLDHGNPMSPADIEDEGIEKKDFSIRVETKKIDDGLLDNFLYGGWKKSGTNMEINEDGTVTVYPSTIANFAPFLLKSGDYEVDLSIDSRENCTGSGTYRIYGNLLDWIYVILILIVIILICYIIWVLTKTRFKNQKVIRSVWESSGTKGGGIMVQKERIERLSPVCLSLFSPFGREVTQSAHGLTFIAQPGAMVKISAKSFSNYDGFRKADAGMNPETNFASIANDNNLKKFDKKNKNKNKDLIIGKNGLYLKQGRKIIWIKVDKGGKKNRNKRSRTTDSRQNSSRSRIRTTSTGRNTAGSRSAGRSRDTAGSRTTVTGRNTAGSRSTGRSRGTGGNRSAGTGNSRNTRRRQ